MQHIVPVRKHLMIIVAIIALLRRLTVMHSEISIYRVIIRRQIRIVHIAFSFSAYSYYCLSEALLTILRRGTQAMELLPEVIAAEEIPEQAASFAFTSYAEPSFFFVVFTNFWLISRFTTQSLTAYALSLALCSLSLLWRSLWV